MWYELVFIRNFQHFLDGPCYLVLYPLKLFQIDKLNFLPFEILHLHLVDFF